MATMMLPFASLIETTRRAKPSAFMPVEPLAPGADVKMRPCCQSRTSGCFAAAKMSDDGVTMTSSASSAVAVWTSGRATSVL